MEPQLSSEWRITEDDQQEDWTQCQIHIASSWNEIHKLDQVEQEGVIPEEHCTKVDGEAPTALIDSRTFNSIIIVYRNLRK